MPTLSPGYPAASNRHAGSVPPMTAAQRWRIALGYFTALGVTSESTVRWLITGPGPTSGPSWLTTLRLSA